MGGGAAVKAILLGLSAEVQNWYHRVRENKKHKEPSRDERSSPEEELIWTRVDMHCRRHVEDKNTPRLLVPSTPPGASPFLHTPCSYGGNDLVARSDTTTAGGSKQTDGFQSCGSGPLGESGSIRLRVLR